MARTSLQDVHELPDPLQSWRFDLFIPNLPGGGDPRGLAVRCKAAVIPGVTLEQVPVDLHGHSVQFRGREVFNHTFACTFVETRDMAARDALMGWLKFCYDVRNTTGKYKSEYAKTMLMVLYDDAEKPIRTIELYGAWPTVIDDITTDGASSTVIELSGTLSYDDFQDVE